VDPDHKRSTPYGADHFVDINEMISTKHVIRFTYCLLYWTWVRIPLPPLKFLSMKKLLFILLLGVTSCDTIYKTTVTYTTDSSGKKVKTIMREYREPSSSNYIQMTPYYDPFRFNNFYYYRPYRPIYIPYNRPSYGHPQSPKPRTRH